MGDPSPAQPQLDIETRTNLLKMARDAIAHGERTGKVLRLDPTRAAPIPKPHHGCFVTLSLDGALRGCVGTVSSGNDLLAAVARSAHQAAFEDPRFDPVTPQERLRLQIEISLLSEPEPLRVNDEGDLLAQLEPGRDGLILREHQRSSTFLPEVWESLPDPNRFLPELKRKAGLAEDHWSSAMRFERYRTVRFGDQG